MPTPADPERCPLCGYANECGIAAGKGTCWCFTRPIPEQMLEKIPPEARDVACMCRPCAFNERDLERTLEQLKGILRKPRYGLHNIPDTGGDYLRNAQPSGRRADSVAAIFLLVGA